MRQLLFILGMFVCISACGAQEQNNRLLSDKELFQVLNLDYPGLESVKQSVESNDYKKAKKEFVVYLKNRKIPKWYFSWRDFAPTKITVGLIWQMPIGLLVMKSMQKHSCDS